MADAGFFRVSKLCMFELEFGLIYIYAKTTNREFKGENDTIFLF